ncbi:CpsD/CapB family tyrosine-protein kinase [Listeria sp. PSOL-1]|uniref:CpsD/CapB family tyrosine-protein kinase n=1 Tax=Listeria sp. PSOL-1 TaxID=1844999 RepID=UPI0013D86447|nr:CpsD/CapB family tyrosine-protein kinase [Listeria sp. PSOL-1]
MKRKNKTSLIDMSLNRIAQEKFSTVQANIEFMHKKDHSIRTFAITSANKGEGKTFFSNNFSRTYAQFKHKVLMIDTDFYAPSLTDQHNLRHHAGLSNILIGSATIKDTIVNLAPNLDIIPIGAIPPNPLELLQVHGLQDTIKEVFTLGYDYLIFDCPPINLFVDARIVASNCDLGILVVNSNKTKEEELLNSKTLMESSGVRSFGAVLNNVKYDQKKYDYYGY